MSSWMGEHEERERESHDGTSTDDDLTCLGVHDTRCGLCGVEARWAWLEERRRHRWGSELFGWTCGGAVPFRSGFSSLKISFLCTKYYFPVFFEFEVYSSILWYRNVTSLSRDFRGFITVMMRMMRMGMSISQALFSASRSSFANCLG